MIRPMITFNIRKVIPLVKSARNFSVSLRNFKKRQCQVLIVGGGAGGCSVAARLSAQLGNGRIIVLDPSETHYLQASFTFVGSGMKRFEQSHKPMGDVLPKKVVWIQEKAVEFEPLYDRVTTSGGITIYYEMLLIAVGLQLNYQRIPGLQEALERPRSKVCSIYSPAYVTQVYDCLRNVRKGNAIFTLPPPQVKCPGASQKMVYIAEHFFRKQRIRDNINIVFNIAQPVIFGVKRYADALWPIIKERNINVNLRRNLVEVKPSGNVAVFANLDNPREQFEESFELLHVVPPMSTPDELHYCRDLVNREGFVKVNIETLQHIKYNNVFAIGDAAGTPNSKTAAAVAAQSLVVANNMLAVLDNRLLRDLYDGYSSCPLITGYSKCILAEFDYNLNPLESFPFAQNKERYSMFLLVKEIMPIIYWNLFLNGYWSGPAEFRNFWSNWIQKKY